MCDRQENDPAESLECSTCGCVA